MSEKVLEIQGLSVSFPGLIRTVQAVRGVDLVVPKGQLLGLVGESGCGKSITAMACLGLVPSPGHVTGSVRIGGYEVVGRSEADLAKVRGAGAAMIFQNPLKALNPFFTVGRQMADAVARHRRLNRKRSRRILAESLRSVGLPDPEFALDKYPHQLSGGQIQRVMIALALACEPKLLIADEPTTALDVTVQAQIIRLLRELAEVQGLTILFITHDLGVVASLCDRVAVMYAGEIVEAGPVETVFRAPGHPYTEKLMATVPVLGRGKAALQFIPGQVPDLTMLPAGCAFHERCEKATELCRKATPVFRPLGPSHQVACHFADDERIVTEGSQR